MHAELSNDAGDRGTQAWPLVHPANAEALEHTSTLWDQVAPSIFGSTNELQIPCDDTETSWVAMLPMVPMDAVSGWQLWPVVEPIAIELQAASA